MHKKKNMAGYTGKQFGLFIPEKKNSAGGKKIKLNLGLKLKKPKLQLHKPTQRSSAASAVFGADEDEEE